MNRLPDAALEALGELGEVEVNQLGRPLTRAELLESVAGADALVTLPGDRVDDELLDAAGAQLRVVANFGVGHDNIDVAACARRGIIATNTPGTLVDTTADLAWALILATPRRIVEGDRLVRAGRPWGFAPDFMLGRDVAGATIGIVGLGAIGQAVARRARGFGCELLYTGPRRRPTATEQELGIAYASLDALLGRSDIVTLHCPLTPSTRHLIDVDALARMRPSAYLVNTARGAIVDEGALVAALRDGGIAGAGLDVYEHEPELHPGLRALGNVVLAPHLGSATQATRERMGLRAAANVAAVLSGQAARDALTAPSAVRVVLEAG